VPCVADIARTYPLETLTVPSLRDLLDLDAVPEYPIERGAYEHRTDPIFVLHTSGSTGIPKPLIYTNEFWARVIDECKLAAPPEHKDVTSYFKTGKFLMTLPGFHVSEASSRVVF
jgi:acyl-coenzyme A synthetase/AMP-(fatty) acid ligase